MTTELQSEPGDIGAGTVGAMKAIARLAPLVLAALAAGGCEPANRARVASRQGTLTVVHQT